MVTISYGKNMYRYIKHAVSRKNLPNVRLHSNTYKEEKNHALSQAFFSHVPPSNKKSDLKHSLTRISMHPIGERTNESYAKGRTDYH